MKILLADFQAPGQDLRGLPEVGDAVAREFPAMLQRKLDEAPGDDLQVSEFKQVFILEGSIGTGHSPNPVNAAAPASLDFLEATRSGAAVAADPPPAVAGEAGADLASSRGLAGVGTAETGSSEPRTGERLPASGSALPPGAVLKPIVESVQESVRPPLEASAGRIAEPVAAPLVAPVTTPDESLRVTPATLENALGERLNPAAPVTLDTRDVATAPQAGPEAVTVLPRGQAPKPGRQQALDSAPATIRASVGAEASVSPPVPPAADAKPNPALTPESSSPPARPVVVSPVPAASPPERSVIAATTVQAPLPDIAENAAVRDAEALTVARNAVQNQPGESMLKDLSLPRGGDQSAPANPGPAQSVVAASAASGLIYPGPGGANPLAAQAETLSLARANDPAAWSQGLGDRVNWMVNHQQNSATIRLDPPMLGKLDVQIRMADDGTTVSIQTQHLQTRDLVEASAVRLRDFLQDSGFQNVSVDVSHRQDQQQARASTLPEADSRAAADDDDPDAAGAASAGLVSSSDSVNLVDTFV